jgi:hypothetical protein
MRFELSKDAAEIGTELVSIDRILVKDLRMDLLVGQVLIQERPDPSGNVVEAEVDAGRGIQEDGLSIKLREYDIAIERMLCVCLEHHRCLIARDPTSSTRLSGCIEHAGGQS